MRKSKIDAIAARLRELEDENQMVYPEVIVEAARDPDDVMHSEFEWDDTAAAQAHRLTQARRLVNRVKLAVSTVSFQLTTPHYVAVTQPRQGYMAIDRVRQAKDLARTTVHNELQRCINAVERARGVADALDLREQLDMVLQQLLAIQAIAKAA